MIIINNNPENQEIHTARFKENIGNYQTGKEVLTNGIYNLSETITIEGKSALILELE
jgi:hypothetical protein